MVVSSVGDVTKTKDYSPWPCLKTLELQKEMETKKTKSGADYINTAAVFSIVWSVNQDTDRGGEGVGKIAKNCKMDNPPPPRYYLGENSYGG